MLHDEMTALLKQVDRILSSLEVQRNKRPTGCLNAAVRDFAEAKRLIEDGLEQIEIDARNLARTRR